MSGRRSLLAEETLIRSYGPIISQAMLLPWEWSLVSNLLDMFIALALANNALVFVALAQTMSCWFTWHWPMVYLLMWRGPKQCFIVSCSLRSWQNCICARSFGGEAVFLAALPREASAEGARKFRIFKASPPHSLRGFFSSTKPKLCARKRSRRLRRLRFMRHWPLHRSIYVELYRAGVRFVLLACMLYSFFSR